MVTKVKDPMTESDAILSLTLADAKAKTDAVIGVTQVRIKERGDALFGFESLLTNNEIDIISSTGVPLSSIVLRPETPLKAVSVGILGDNSTSNKASVERAVSISNRVSFGDGVFLMNNIIIPDGVDIEASSEKTVFKKDANGFIFDLGRYGKITGGPTFNGNDTGGGFTGNSVVINRGENSATTALQGHQKIIDATFINSESYHVAYLIPNGGYLSRLVRCQFTEKPQFAPAAVLWPDETATGGNRYIDGGYSISPIVNANGCDNGSITGVTTGSSASSTDQGIFFDAGAVNKPEKIAIIGNRFAIGGKSMNIRGREHTFEGNIIAGNLVFEAGADFNNFGDSNLFAASFGVTANNGLINYVTISKVTAFTPTISSGVTLGDGALTGEFTRGGQYIDFTIELSIGSTTAVTGSIKFNLPFTVISAVTFKFLGNAWADDYTGMTNIDRSTSTLTINNTATRAVWNATVPKVWATGDVITITGRYPL